MLSFLIGFVVGCSFGVVLAAMLRFSRDAGEVREAAPQSVRRTPELVEPA